MTPSHNDSKTAWRHWAKPVRAALPTPELSRGVTEQLRAWPPYQRAQRVLSYLAFGSELDLSALHQDAKTFYVTRTQPEELSVHVLGEGLERHPYGYLQPTPGSPRAETHTVDLALVPGLCYDRTGTRLGYGKGYYDRLLPNLRPDVPRVGVCPAALIVNSLPKDKYDVSMTQLASEWGIEGVAS